MQLASEFDEEQAAEDKLTFKALSGIQCLIVLSLESFDVIALGKRPEKVLSGLHMRAVAFLAMEEVLQLKPSST